MIIERPRIQEYNLVEFREIKFGGHRGHHAGKIHDHGSGQYVCKITWWNQTSFCAKLLIDQVIPGEENHHGQWR